MSKYDHIFKTTKDQQSQKAKLAPNLKQHGKTLAFNRFTDQHLTRQNGLAIKAEDNRPVIDLFDENNREQQPALIIYDPVKGIYVMQNPPGK
ncbi:MAG: hypothetical protein EIB84_05830 [Spiroplasma poulsonii]|uniref:hypothetical protein n=1 Tax=Spiroplasma poulsonii TaxID=2138 RepID=UPI00058A1F62|nr:hypothetical protein [Spiroplasma poulsonii]MBW1242290.1 hypothetical protein [Spiroplasma poulsonii]